MSLQIEWPTNGWPDAVVERVRAAIEGAIRKAMNPSAPSSGSGGSGAPPTASSAPSSDSRLAALMRGTVTVDGLSLGSVAPEVSLRRIVELSPARSAIVARIAYRGDAWLSMRGIEINLDPTRAFAPASPDADAAPSGQAGAMSDAAAVVVAPFFCPLTLRIKDMALRGDLRVEVYHEPVDAAAAAASAGSASAGAGAGADAAARAVPLTFTQLFLGDPTQPQQQQHPPGDAGATTPARPAFRRRMLVQLIDDQVVASAGGGGGAGGGAVGSASHAASAGGGGGGGGSGDDDGFVRDFSVESNFVPVPQAVAKIKGTIRAALKPLFQRLRSPGLSFDL
jgi:hypothetical protein